MAILVDATTGEHARGIGTVIERFLDELPGHAGDVVVAAGPRLHNALGVPSHGVGLAGTRPGRLLYQRVLLPFDVLALRRRGQDIDRVLLLDAYMPILPWGRRTAYAVYVHDVLPLTHPQYWPPEKRLVKTVAFRTVKWHKPRVFTSTEHNVALVERVLGLEARVAMYGCGQLTDAEADAAFDAPLGRPAPYLIAVGTIEQRKDPVTLIRAFELVADRLPQLHLRIVGGGPPDYIDLVRTRASQSPVRDRISFHASLDREATLELIAKASALVMPSFAEGFGLPILEALALGTPVVASDIPEIRSWAGEAILYGVAGDPRSWAGPIEAALSAHDERRHEGREFARAFRWRTFTEQLLTF
jgi:glycosyltransferase involved in cell wall biosynthesis